MMYRSEKRGIFEGNERLKEDGRGHDVFKGLFDEDTEITELN